MLQLHCGTNPGLQLFPVTEQPMPRTLEHWHTPGDPLPVPVEPEPPEPPPQLQFTVCEGTTAARKVREGEWRPRNALEPVREDSAVNPGNLIFACVFMASPISCVVELNLSSR